MQADLRAKIEEAATHYPDRRSAIMPALFLAQQEYAWLTSDVLVDVAAALDVPEIWTFEIATFYSLLHTEPVGKYNFQVCTNVSCMLLRAETLVRHLENELGIKCGETSVDGQFSLRSVECLGSCDTAPVLMINADYHENMTEQKLDEFLANLKIAEEV